MIHLTSFIEIRVKKEKERKKKNRRGKVTSANKHDTFGEAPSAKFCRNIALFLVPALIVEAYGRGATNKIYINRAQTAFNQSSIKQSSNQAIKQSISSKLKQSNNKPCLSSINLNTNEYLTRNHYNFSNMHLPRCLQFNKNTNANTSSTKANTQHVDASSDATLVSGYVLPPPLFLFKVKMSVCMLTWE